MSRFVAITNDGGKRVAIPIIAINRIEEDDYSTLIETDTGYHKTREDVDSIIERINETVKAPA